LSASAELLAFIIHAADVVRRRDIAILPRIYVYVCGCVGMNVSTIKAKPLIGMTWTWHSTLSRPIDFGFKNQCQVHMVIISNFWHPFISVERI